MTTPKSDLPADIIERVLSFCNVDPNGEPQVVDMRGLAGFVAENAEEWPGLLELISVNEDAVIRHIQETGDVPPGIKLVKKTKQAGSNVTRVQIVHGPGRVEPD